jgi:hypothetical protein
MILDNDLLTALGINLSDDQATALSEHFEETLQERIGLAIFDTLDDEQVATLLKLQETGNDPETAAWVKQNVPDYEAIVQDQIDILLGELASDADNLAA